MKKQTNPRMNHPIVRFFAKTMSPFVRFDQIYEKQSIVSALISVAGEDSVTNDVFRIRGKGDDGTLRMFARTRFRGDVCVRDRRKRGETIIFGFPLIDALPCIVNFLR